MLHLATSFYGEITEELKEYHKNFKYRIWNIINYSLPSIHKISEIYFACVWTFTYIGHSLNHFSQLLDLVSTSSFPTFLRSTFQNYMNHLIKLNSFLSSFYFEKFWVYRLQVLVSISGIQLFSGSQMNVVNMSNSVIFYYTLFCINKLNCAYLWNSETYM